MRTTDEESFFQDGKTYVAVVHAVGPDGTESYPSKEVQFSPGKIAEGKEGPKLPLTLQLKVLGATLKSYID